MLSFPPTFRVVGPDSNSGFRSYILDNQLELVKIHPNTENLVPELATHWAYKGDNKTMFFKLNKKARWSDGAPLTAHDFAYTMKFLRSEHIVYPYYNEVFAEDKYGGGSRKSPEQRIQKVFLIPLIQVPGVFSGMTKSFMMKQRKR